MIAEIEEARHIVAGLLSQAHYNNQPEKALKYWEDLSALTQLHYRLNPPAVALTTGPDGELRVLVDEVQID